MTRALGFLLASLALGCTTPISTELREPETRPKLAKLVIVPFLAESVAGISPSADAAAVVTTRVLGAMTQGSSFEVVPPDEAARVPEIFGPNSGEAMRRQFGADAVLRGEVRRFVERSGGPAGTNRPASVCFSLELRSPDGALLWSGSYDETQKPLSEDLGSLGRAWQRGFRWVTAADLADYGATELVRALVADTETWN